MEEKEEKYHDFLNHKGASLNGALADFLKKTANATLPDSKSKESIWTEIENEIDGKKNPFLTPWRITGIAATILLATLMSFIIFKSSLDEIKITSHIGEKVNHTLPDNSMVTINAKSHLTYSERWNRSLSLEGEAFFQVKRGEKFTVSTSYGKVRVLGTSFNVYAREGTFEVSCKTGKVEVLISDNSRADILNPGEMISVRSDTIRKILREPELMGKWQSGEFYFENQPINLVFEEMKRQFEIEIEFSGNQNLEFNGYFSNKSLDQALNMVCLPLGLEYKKARTKIIISGRE